MNYEVSSEYGYQASEGLMAWAGKSLYSVKQYLIGNIVSEDGDLFAGGEYRVSDPSLDHKGEIKFIFSDGESAYFQFLSGVWEDYSEIRIYPDREDLDTYWELDNVRIEEYESVEDFKEKYKFINSHLAANHDFRPPGVGPINLLFELDDVIYAARDLPDNSGSQLYRTTDLKDLDSPVAWEPVDMGYEVEFQNGRTEPFTLSSRKFLGLTPGESRDIIDRAGGKATSVLYSQGQENQIAWQTIENVLDVETEDETSSRGFVALGQGVLPDQFKTTQALRITGLNIGEDQPESAQVRGIEVSVRYEHAHTQERPANDSDKKARFLSARLLNVGSTANKANTTIRTANQSGAAGHGIRTETLGSDSDDWNATELTRERVFSDDFGVELVFAHAKGSSLSDLWYGAFTKVYWVKVSVYFEDATERIYFYDLGTSTDVAEAEVSELTLSEGSWQSGTAGGRFSLYNAINPENITDNIEIRTDSNGGGVRIAATKGSAARALLPTSEEMAENKSFARTIKANFFLDAERESIYGVTGAGPAFMYNGFYFHNIRAPIPVEKDKPRHIAEHEEHLVLGYNSGSILVSVAGAPTNFSGLEGASEWGFGDNIVGLAPLPGAALAVLCKQSSHGFLGTNLDNFSTQTISKTSGAIEYTDVNMGTPLYADSRGISSIQNTEQFGDFLAGRISQRITPILRDRLQQATKTALASESPVIAIPVRNKNQYRLFFKDGLICTLTLFGSADEQPTFTLQKYGYLKDNPNSLEYVPTSMLSTVLSDGTEVLLLGTSSGDIYVMDQGTGIIKSNGIEVYDAQITFNPFTGGEPHQSLKYNEVVLHGKTSGGNELVTSAGVNYLSPEPFTETDEIIMGEIDSGFNLNRIPQKKSTHLPNVTSGFSLKIESQADGNIPHIIQALTYRPSVMGDTSVGQKRYTGQV